MFIYTYSAMNILKQTEEAEKLVCLCIFLNTFVTFV